MTTDPQASPVPSSWPEGMEFDKLSRLVLGEPSLTAVLQRVAELARAVVPGVGEAAATMMTSANVPETAVFTSTVAYQLDQCQHEAGSGPSIDTARTGMTIQVSGAEPGGPYPRFSRACREAAVTHSLSVALRIPRRVVGTLTMHTTSHQAFDEQAIELAEGFARYAGVAITNAARYSNTAGANGSAAAYV